MSETPEYEVVDAITHSAEVQPRENTRLSLAAANATMESSVLTTVQAAAEIGDLGGEEQIDLAIRVSVPEADESALIEGDGKTTFAVEDAPETVSIEGAADLDLSDQQGNRVSQEIELLAKRFWGN